MPAKPLPKGQGIAMPAPDNFLMVPCHVEPRYAKYAGWLQVGFFNMQVDLHKP